MNLYFSLVTVLSIWLLDLAAAPDPLSDCPLLVTRADWEARATRSVEYLSGPVQYVFIHHTSGSSCYDADSCKARVQSIQNFHMDTRGWDDIGYSFLVSPSGELYEGRGWDRVGAHTYGYNRVGLAFSFIGSYFTVAPTQAAMDTVQQAIRCGVKKGKIIPDYILRGHKDVVWNTTCPGETLHGIIQKWPHY